LVVFFAAFAVLMVWYALRLLPLRLLRHVSRSLTRRLARGIQRGWARKVVLLARAAAGVRVAVEGAPPLEPGVFVVVSNHQSILEAMRRAGVLPVALDGTFRAASFASLLSDFPGLEIRVRVGTPFEVPAEDRGSAEKMRLLGERCRAFCETALGEWRATPVAP